MRRILPTCATALTALAVAAAPALAVQSKQGLRASINPTKTGTSKKPKKTALTVNPFLTYSAADDATPFATTKAVIYLDKNLRFNGSRYASCTAGKVTAGTCSSKARVGSGSAKGRALGQEEDLRITAYNGPGGRSLNMRIVGSDPLQINQTIVGTLSSASGAYGRKLTVPIPDGLQQPAPGIFATLLDFKLTVGSTKSDYVTTVGCTSGGLRLRGVLTFTDGTTQTADTRARCSKA